MVITPPYAQVRVQLLLRAGFPPIKTKGEPGVHGAGMTGMHGMGVSTPKAAAVAEATVGLAKELHVPKDIIFTIGTLSIVVASGIVFCTPLAGRTFSTDVAAPNGHFNIAPDDTHIPISFLLYLILSPYMLFEHTIPNASSWMEITLHHPQ